MEPRNGAEVRLTVLIVAIAVASLAYRLVTEAGLAQTSALYIGVPALLAIILAFTPKAASPMGMIFKGTTLALLMSGILFAEGFV